MGECKDLEGLTRLKNVNTFQGRAITKTGDHEKFESSNS